MSAALPILAAIGLGLVLMQRSQGGGGGNSGVDKQALLANIISRMSMAQSAAEKQAIIEEVNRQGYVQTAQALTMWVNGIGTVDAVRAAALAEFK